MEAPDCCGITAQEQSTGQNESSIRKKWKRSSNPALQQRFGLHDKIFSIDAVKNQVAAPSRHDSATLPLPAGKSAWLYAQ